MRPRLSRLALLVGATAAFLVPFLGSGPWSAMSMSRDAPPADAPPIPASRIESVPGAAASRTGPGADPSAPSTAIAAAPDDWSLAATTLTGDPATASALLAQGSGAARRYRSGDALGGGPWTLAAIAPDHVVLAAGARSHRLDLQDRTAPEPAGPRITVRGAGIAAGSQQLADRIDAFEAGEFTELGAEPSDPSP